jgi:hypothetical protein
MKKNKVIIFYIVVFVNLCLTSCSYFVSGSYPFAEIYTIKISEVKLIKAIEDFKKNNRKFDMPPSLNLIDGRNENYDYWYHIYFYDSSQNQIIHTWTRPIDKSKTSFALVSINNIRKTGDWKKINNDFSFFENIKIKKSFEVRLLRGIYKYIKIKNN